MRGERVHRATAVGRRSRWSCWRRSWCSLLVSARGDPLRELPAQAGGLAADASRNLEHEYHLDESVPEQYVALARRLRAGRLGRVVPAPSGRSPTWWARPPGTRSCWSAPRVVLSVMLALVHRRGERGAPALAVRLRWRPAFSYFGFSMPDFFFALLLQLVRGGGAARAVRHPRASTCRASTRVGERGRHRQPDPAHGAAGARR